ncbi:biopolymer transporter ExbD/TolR [Gillisia marina]|uniref:biopolymer transporter ExbD/TolR n=1 Tax=Gillisia marina TaxID=1167637 RepID=UPI00029B3DD6|nr:biopolymer transporter ExbD/TolR [Gillisia marina]
MKNYKYLLLFLVLTSFSIVAQNKTNSPKSLIVNVLIDVNKNIYIEEMLTQKDQIGPNIKKLISTKPANKYEGVTYRIFADGSLQHGTIMDVNTLLLKGYQPIQTKTEKYLLDLKANNLDGPDWVDQLNKLDLKASRIN